MADFFKLLDANIEIPLGTGFETQTVSGGNSNVTSITIEIEDNASLEELFARYNVVIFDSTCDVKVSETFDKEYSYNANVAFEDSVNVSEQFDISYTNNGKVYFVDDINLSEEYTKDYTYNVSKTFIDNVIVSEEFNIAMGAYKSFIDNVIVNENFSCNVTALNYFGDDVTISEQFSMKLDTTYGNLVLLNTVKNKYVDEPFIDQDVTVGKQYKYIVKTFNDFNNYSDEQEIEITVQNAGDIEPPANATLEVVYRDGYFYVYCTDPDNSDWNNTTVRYNVNNIVTDKFSGIKLFDNNEKNKYATSPYKFQAVPGKTYYFKAFTKDNVGNVNESMECISITTYIPGGIVPPAPVSNLKVVLNEDNKTVNVTWEDPSDTDWTSTAIVKKEGSIPENINDGTAIQSTIRDQYKTNPLVISVPDENVTYYFKAFPKNEYVYLSLII